MSEKPQSKIVWLMPARLSVAVVFSAELIAWLRKDTTRRTYLLFRDEQGKSLLTGLPKTLRIPGAMAIISKLRDIYGPSGARFSVLSERPGRVVICAWWSSETTQSESQPSSGGPPV